MTMAADPAMLCLMSTDPTVHEQTLAGLIAPLPFAVRSLLRTAARELVRTERRVVFPPQLHVGTPGGFVVSTPVADAPTDFGTRVDLIHAMVRRAEVAGTETPTGSPWVWMTRSGPNIATDLDPAFLAPAIQAFSEAGQMLTYFVVTRRGWHDPRSGLGRTWTRIRAA